MIKTNVDDFVSELGAGVVKEKLAVALSEVAMGVCQYGTKNHKGKLVIEFDFVKMGDHDQMIVSHKIKTKVLTKRGCRSEEDTTSSAFFVGKGGAITATPPKEEQTGQFTLGSVD